MACVICDKHRGSGPLICPVIFEDDLLVITHRPAVGGGGTVPGYVFVETRRHVARLAQLTAAEVRACADAVWCISRALEMELEPQNVFSAIAGRSVAHFHQHVFVRPVGTSDDVAWNDVDSAVDAPRVDDGVLQELCDRLSIRFENVWAHRFP